MKPIQSEVDKCLDLVKELFDNGLHDALFYRAIPNQYGKEPSWECGIYDWIDNHYETYNEKNIYFYTGLTKLCIVMKDNKDWVIKLALVRDNVPVFDCHSNFCELEARNFEAAEQRGLDKYFAAEYEVGTINDIKVFMQEYVEMNEDLICNSCFDYVKEGYDEDDFETHDDYINAIYSEADYLEDEEKIKALMWDDCDELIEFINDYHINDLHNGNWGINKNGKIVLVDYSGFCK